jgi:hypothetical protein
VTLARELAAHVAMTAPMWRKIAEPLATWFHGALLTGKVVQPPAVALPGFDQHTAFHAHAWKRAGLRRRPVPATCMHCGRALTTAHQRKFCSHDCAR